MGKLLLIIVAVLVVYFIVKSYQRNLQGPPPPRARPKVGEDMVRCAHCGVHHPRSESTLSAGEFFCSEEHRRLHRG